MRRPALIALAMGIDAVIGDPESWPHPVRLFGYVIARGERLLRRTQSSPAEELVAGAILTATLTCATYVVTDQTLRKLNAHSPLLRSTAALLLAASCLASRSLDQEAAQVLDALEREDLAAARVRVSRIVGRDTAHLDVFGVSRAVIETLAESASDGVIAPLFYLAMGGVPLAMTFKMISTMDSMIGHRDQRYRYFGRCAARLDDAVNLLPSRLTAALIVLSSGPRWRQAARIWLRDGGNHQSPNAGQPEAAMAGALGVRLGGVNRYAGELHDAPLMGSEFHPPTILDVRHARSQVRRLTLLAAVTAVAVMLLARRGRR